MKSKKELPLIADCNGCGVCCFHMGYPPFIRPVAPMTTKAIESEMETNNQLRSAVNKDPQLVTDLQRGRDGEKWWHLLPQDLRDELDAYIAEYQPRNYGDDVSSFDGPCFWLDMETRLCKHHQHRPNVCRDFDTGSKKCLEWRKHYIDRVKKIV